MSLKKKEKDSPSGQSKKRFQATVGVALETIKIVKDIVPMEPAKGALELIYNLLSLLETYMQNKDDLSDIAERCQRVAVIIKKAMESGSLPKDGELEKAIDKLKIFVEGIRTTVEKNSQRNAIRRFFSTQSDAAKILELKEALRDFLLEFQVELGIFSTMGQQKILDWVKVQPIQPSSEGQRPSTPFSLSTRPRIFFGREQIVNNIVECLLNEEHVALIGAGGMGKSSISKAVLNEEAIVFAFNERLFISYDNLDSSAMTFQTFLDRIGDALELSSTATQKSIFEHLRKHERKSILVIDNAETFLEASSAELARITDVLDEMDSLPHTRIIITTRTSEVIPPNIVCRRITVTGLPIDAACQAFAAVYKLAPVDETIKKILAALDFHPLSINILANAAETNQWSAERLEEAWAEQILDSAAHASKYRSLRVSVEISISCPVFYETKEAVLRLLQALAFLPQGIHRRDIPGILPGDPAMRIAESLCRCSLAYWRGDRITLLAPIRLYVAGKYNERLLYDHPLVSIIRRHYYTEFRKNPEIYMEHEHENIDRVLYFDMSSELYCSDVKVRGNSLSIAQDFLYCLSEKFPRTTSLWPLLLSDGEHPIYNADSRLASRVSLCLTWACWLDYHRGQYTTALQKLDKAELFCRNHSPGCDDRLARCLRLQGIIHRTRGNLALADDALRKGSAIGLRDAPLFDDSLSRVALARGNIAEAISLVESAQKYFEANQDHLHLIHLFLHRADIVVLQGNDFDNARQFIQMSVDLDRQQNNSRQHLRILCWKASLEGWAGRLPVAEEILDEAIKTSLLPGIPQFDSYVAALRGKAYYEAHSGKFDQARQRITDAAVLPSEKDPEFLSGRFALVLAYIELFAGDYANAQKQLNALLNSHDQENRQLIAMIHRAMGEISYRNQDVPQAQTHFSDARSMCIAMGMAPRCLYADYCHWYALPEEYTGWSMFLDNGL